MSEDVEKILEEWKKLLKKRETQNEQKQLVLNPPIHPKVQEVEAKIQEYEKSLEEVKKAFQKIEDKKVELERQELAKKYGEEFATAYIALKPKMKPIIFALLRIPENNKSEKVKIARATHLVFQNAGFLEKVKEEDIKGLTVLLPEEVPFSFRVYILEYEIRTNYDKKLKDGQYSRYIKCFKYALETDQAILYLQQRVKLLESLEALKQPKIPQEEMEKQELVRKYGKDFAEAYVQIREKIKPILFGSATGFPRNRKAFVIEHVSSYEDSFFWKVFPEEIPPQDIPIILPDEPKKDEIYLLDYKVVKGEFFQYVKCYKYTTDLEEAIKVSKERLQILLKEFLPLKSKFKPVLHVLRDEGKFEVTSFTPEAQEFSYLKIIPVVFQEPPDPEEKAFFVLDYDIEYKLFVKPRVYVVDKLSLPEPTDIMEARKSLYQKFTELEKLAGGESQSG